MSDSNAKQIDDNELPVLAKAARLPITADRHPTIGPALNGVLQLFDALDAVKLGETPPTNAFDPRWRRSQ